MQRSRMVNLQIYDSAKSEMPCFWENAIYTLFENNQLVRLIGQIKWNWLE